MFSFFFFSPCFIIHRLINTCEPIHANRSAAVRNTVKYCQDNPNQCCFYRSGHSNWKTTYTNSSNLGLFGRTKFTQIDSLNYGNIALCDLLVAVCVCFQHKTNQNSGKITASIYFDEALFALISILCLDRNRNNSQKNEGEPRLPF